MIRCKWAGPVNKQNALPGMESIPAINVTLDAFGIIIIIVRQVLLLTPFVENNKKVSSTALISRLATSISILGAKHNKAFQLRSAWNEDIGGPSWNNDANRG